MRWKMTSVTPQLFSQLALTRRLDKRPLEDPEQIESRRRETKSLQRLSQDAQRRVKRALGPEEQGVHAPPSSTPRAQSHRATRARPAQAGPLFLGDSTSQKLARSCAS
jgi:hypothetical protein